MSNIKAKAKFIFKTRISLPEITSLKASNLKELLEGIMVAEPGVIFNHTHNFSLARQLLALELTNDFAYWVKNVLLEEELSERLAAINILECKDLEEVRHKHMAVLNTHIGINNSFKDAPVGQEFYFTKSNALICDTGKSAKTLREFWVGLQGCSLSSIFYHMLEYKIRLGNPENEFSHWLRHSLAQSDLADIISKINPYNFPLLELKNFLIEVTEDFLKI